MRRSLLARVICMKSTSVRKNGQPSYISRRTVSPAPRSTYPPRAVLAPGEHPGDSPEAFDLGVLNPTCGTATHVEQGELPDGRCLGEEFQEVLVLIDEPQVGIARLRRKVFHHSGPVGLRLAGRFVGR